MSPTSSLRERLLEAMAERKVTQSDLARACKISTAAVSGWFRVDRPVRELKHSNLVIVARVLHVTETWLATGRGSKYLANPVKRSTDSQLQADMVLSTLRLRGIAAAPVDVPILPWSDASNPEENREKALQFAPRHDGMGPSVYAVRVVGAAMEPEFRAGWIAYIDPEASASDGDFVLAALEGSVEPVLRELRFEAGEKYLRATNPDFPLGFIPLGAGRIIGRVIFQGRSY